jgi:negative regulator of sigma E activity
MISRISAIALVFALAPNSAPAASREAPMALLRDAMNAPSAISYVGEVQMLRFGPNKSEAAVFHIEHKAPDLTRRWYLAPQDLYGDSIISQRDSTYSIDVKRSRVVVTHEDPIDDQVDQDDNFSLLNQNYRADYAPETGLVSGHRADTVLLYNKYTGQLTMRVYVDKKTKLVLEKELFAPSGALVSQTRFEALRYTNSIPAALFAVPKGMPTVNGMSHEVPSTDLQTALKSAGFDARGPQYLPEGFTPLGGEVTDVKGVRTLHLLYSDGLRTISLFENKSDAAVDLSQYKATATHVESVPAKYVQDGPTTLLAWSQDDLHFALVGDVELSELEAIGASVVGVSH